MGQTVAGKMVETDRWIVRCAGALGDRALPI